MVSTQPLPPLPISPLRLVSNSPTDADFAPVPVTPIFDLTPPSTTQIHRLLERTEVHHADLTPFSFDDYPLAAVDDSESPIADLVTEADQPALAHRSNSTQEFSQTSELPLRQTGFLSGVSLSAILQMLHLDRKSCIVEVSAHGRLGSLTLVNGELVDATVGELNGEDAAFIILNWTFPQTAILDGVEFFRHTVQRPITQLIMDAVRIGDETGLLDPSKLPEYGNKPIAETIGEWQWLIDSLTLAGARNARIVQTESNGNSEQRHSGNLDELSGDVARGIRTWASLMGPDVTEIVATRGDRIIVMAVLDLDHATYAYAEATGPETAELIRRSLRSVLRPH